MKGEVGAILQISASHGGVPKRAIESAEIDEHGITIDRQADRKAHGHPHQALCIFAAERLADLAAKGHNLAPGHLGENITTHGIDWDLVVPGVKLELGPDVVCEVTAYTTPCWKNAHWFRDGDITRIHQSHNPGYSRVYARVLTGGTVATSDEVRLVRLSAAERVRQLQPKTFRWSPPGND